MISLRLISVAISLVVVAGSIASLAAASVWDGLFTEAQAKRGASVYAEQCAECHAEDLTGDTPYNPSPSLAGAGFLSRWDNKTLDELFELIRTRMPKRREGTLKPQESADVTAFILRSNRFPASTTELSSDVAALRDIRILKTRP